MSLKHYTKPVYRKHVVFDKKRKKKRKYFYIFSKKQACLKDGYLL